MFKLFRTVLRGHAFAVVEAVEDQNALLILDQQIRDVAAAVAGSRRALAIATAQEEAERQAIARTTARILDLEARALDALRAGRDDLASEAASAIADLENDRQAAETARGEFGAEMARLRRALADAARRFANLQRGRRVAAAAEAVRRIRSGSAASASFSTLAEAEATLERLRRRQAEDAAIDQAEDERRTGADAVAERLEEAGFGPATRTTASVVLDRLKARAATADAA
ncbi:MAG: PspA/IM30 family protein [Alsobacter sp.]